MKAGDIAWVRLIHEPANRKTSGIIEFIKGDDVVLSIDDHGYLQTFKRHELVDPPTDKEIESEEVARIIGLLFDELKTIQGRNAGALLCLEKLGYSISKIAR